jgi:hypothetical protein
MFLHLFNISYEIDGVNLYLVGLPMHSHGKEGTHLEKIQFLLQSHPAILKQHIVFPLTEELLECAPILLGFNKCMYLMECPK